MRCPDCNKFVPLETQDPEIDALDVDLDPDGTTATITGNVRVVRNCEECGTELKEGNFDISESVDISEPQEGHEHALMIEEVSSESTESGGARYKANLVGFSLDYVITCSGCDLKVEGQVEDSMKASYYDELV